MNPSFRVSKIPESGSSQTAPNLANLQDILEMANSEQFKVISECNALEVHILAVRSWMVKGPKNLPVNLSFHKSSGIAEVSIGQTAMIGNSFIDIASSYTAQIGELTIENDGNKFNITLNEEAQRFIEESKDERGFHIGFAQVETLSRLIELRDSVGATLKNLREDGNRFGGAKFFGVSDYVLEAALEAERLKDDPRFASYKSNGILNIDALTQLSHRHRYEKGCDEFMAIELNATQEAGAPSSQIDYRVVMLNIPNERRAQLNDFLITNVPIRSTDELTFDSIASRGIPQYHLSLLDNDRNIVASATVWRTIPNNDPRFEAAYNEAIENGADPRGGIVLFEMNHVTLDAPKGTIEKLRDLVNIVFAQTNCETLVEIGLSPKVESITSTSYSLSVPQSQLAARRMLRMAAGQIFLARTRVAEIVAKDGLSQEEGMHLFEVVKKDLNGWLRLAYDSVRPNRPASSLNRADIEIIEEWEHWARNSPLGALLENSSSFAFTDQILGANRFAPDYSLENNGDEIRNGSASRIIESIGIASGESTAYVAEYQLSTLTPSIRESLAKMLQKWRIDDSRKTRQMGFEWLVTEEELKGYLQKDSAVFQILISDDKPAGVMITFTDIGLTERPEQKMPSAGGSVASKAWCDEHAIPYEKTSYCYIVAIDRDLRKEFNAGNIPAYPMLLDAMEETAGWLGIEHVLGGVRIDGENHLGNVAMSAHIRNGWIPQPFTFKSRIGSDLQLVSRKIPDRESPIIQNIPYSAFIFPNASQLNRILGDPAQLAEADRQAKDAIRSADQAQKFADVWLKENRFSYCRAEKDHGTLSGEGPGICIWKNNGQYYFYQDIAGQDHWRNRDTGKVGTFKDCLDYLAQDLRRPPY